MNGTRSVYEQRWLESVVEFATDSNWLVDMYGEHVKSPKLFQIDHILGSKAKRKIWGQSQRVGEMAIMPLPIELHDITSNHPLNRTLKPGAFRRAFGHETLVFKSMVNAMEREGFESPDPDIIFAILR